MKSSKSVSCRAPLNLDAILNSCEGALTFALKSAGSFINLSPVRPELSTKNCRLASVASCTESVGATLKTTAQEATDARVLCGCVGFKVAKYQQRRKAALKCYLGLYMYLCHWTLSMLSCGSPQVAQATDRHIREFKIVLKCIEMQ